MSYSKGWLDALINLDTRLDSIEAGGSGSGSGGSSSIEIVTFPERMTMPLTVIGGGLIDRISRIYHGGSGGTHASSEFGSSLASNASSVTLPESVVGTTEEDLCWVNDTSVSGEPWLSYSFDYEKVIVSMVHLRCCNGKRGTNALIQVSSNANQLMASWTTIHTVDDTKWVPSNTEYATSTTFEEYKAFIPVTQNSQFWRNARIIFDDGSECAYDLFVVYGVISDL